MTNAEARFNKSHIRKVYACLAVTCHLHFWQNDRDFLCATAVTRGWNGYRNKSQHRKSTLEKKILPPFQQGFEPVTFQSRVRRSNHRAIPAPNSCLACLVLFIASWPRKLKGCLGEGVAHDAFVTSVTHSGLVRGVTDIATVFLSVFGTTRHLWVVVFVTWEQSCIVVIYSVSLFLICCCFATDTCKRGAATRGPEQQAYEV